MQIPVTLLCGTEEGKTVLLTSGTHGAEFLGVETAIRLCSELDPKALNGNVAIVHPVNLPQFYAKTAYVGHYDGKNLNRVYPGLATGTVSERIAYTITSNLLQYADFYIDMHSGDIHETLTPYIIHSSLGNEDCNRLSAEAAGLFGARYKVFSSGNSSALGWAAMHNIPGVLPEIGEGARWTEDEVTYYKTGVRNVLSLLGVISDPIVDMGPCEQLSSMDVIMCEQRGLWYPAFRGGDKVAKGESVGQLRDYFGNVLVDYAAPLDGTVLFECSSMSINPGDPVIGIG